MFRVWASASSTEGVAHPKLIYLDIDPKVAANFNFPPRIPYIMSGYDIAKSSIS